MYNPQEEKEVPALFCLHVEESELLYKPFAHPFGVQIKYFQAKRSLTLKDIERKSDVDHTVISRMCNGERLKGTRTRKNILQIINALRQFEVLEYVDEANDLLETAEQEWLEYGDDEVDNYLLDNLATRSGSSQKPKFVTISEEVEIYKGSAKYLLENGSKNIRVYAPLALWHKSLYKEPHWFSVLAKYLSDNLDAQAQMVFGVPHRKGSYEDMKETLSVFKELEKKKRVSDRKAPSMAIRYIPPIKHQDPPPAIGMTVFDSEVVAIGFGVRDAMEKIDTGWVLFDEEAAGTAKEWFDSKIWPQYQDYELMRTEPRSQRMSDGFAMIEEEYADQFTDDW